MHDQLWMLYRLELLRHVVVPTLSAQSNQTFRWVIFIDQNIAPLVELRLKEVLRPIGDCEVVRLTRYGDRIAQARSLTAQFGQDFDYVIQTRIDDDDAMHVDALRAIRGVVESLVSDGRKRGVIGLANGFDFLCESLQVCANPKGTLAIGLSIFHPASQEHGIFDYSHDVLCDSFLDEKDEKGWTSLTLEGGSYLYSKHSLCDSSYFGMRGRVHGAPDVVSHDSDAPFWSNFGLSAENVSSVAKIFSAAPVSYPRPAIGITVDFDGQSGDADAIRRQKKYVMRKMVRGRLRKDDVYVLCLGDVAARLGAKAKGRYLDGRVERISPLSFMRKDSLFACDILLVDELVLCDLAEVFPLDEIVARFRVIEPHVDYILISRWNALNHARKELFEQVFAALEKRVFKLQEIGGWQIDESDNERIEAIVDATAELIARNSV
jgi:hypothetical protein